MNNTGSLYIVSAPSGAGKTSLLKALTDKIPSIATSISTTTREIRPGEVNGVDYHFVSVESFQQRINEGDFLEHAEVFGNFYGTSESKLMGSLNSGKDIVLEIDWQGAQQIRKKHPETISIFILPPSRNELEKRLQGRGQDSDEVINKRMKAAIKEISHYNEYDYLVINDDFDTALAELEHIFLSNRLTLAKQSQIHQQLITDLL